MSRVTKPLLFRCAISAIMAGTIFTNTSMADSAIFDARPRYRSCSSVFLRVFLLLIAAHPCAFALGQLQYIETHFTPGCFPIVNETSVATLFVDSNDFPGVIRAANDLQTDIARVTNHKPSLTSSQAGLGTNAIIIGTLGKSRLIAELVRPRKIHTAQ